MNQLDAMAARAVDSVHVAVATRAPVANLPRLAARRRRALAARVAFGAAALVGIIGVAGLVQMEDTAQPAATTTMVTTTTTTTTIAPPVVETTVPLIPIPEGPGDPVTVEPVTPVVTEPSEPKEPVEPVDTTPPALTITSPDDGAKVDTTAVRFRGTTEPGATVAAGQWQATVDAEGHWSLVLIVREGRNTARFTATDAAGNQTVESITVVYEPVKEPTADFVAFATYGSCEFDPPYDIYYGEALPGAKITITSEFGSGATTVGDGGNWELKVFFPEAPYGKTFLVTAKDGLGGVKKFEFTSFAGGA